MATTTNFGWETPDDTDLVKDGAAAIRTALGGVDASFVDLKGGTTGQLLSKASNTDLDYTWVSGSGSSIQNTIVDAKGDLIAASAADTPARLAVGSDYGFLQADSAQSTGLAWNAGAWTSYTPTVTASSGSYTTINVQGAYQRIGKTCIVRVFVNVDNKGTASAGMNITLPFTGKNIGQTGTGSENLVTGNTLTVILDPSATIAIVRKYDFTTAWNNGWGNAIQITYEVA
jgi:hypothetical protein